MIAEISNQIVEKFRPPKAELDVNKPYLYLHEQEVQKDGVLTQVNTIFLTNKECSFKCVMCDLWRHTTNETTPGGSIPRQIEYALKRLPEASVVKLYNSGNFFDRKAIPESDYQVIADLISGYEHVIVENHPKLVGPFIRDFRELLNGSFEVAMGLETIHPDVLPRLNKQITANLFRQSTEYLTKAGIDVRAFILLNPPFLTDEAENIEWCLRSVQFAFDAGVTAVSVIPTRGGNGIMEKLEALGEFVSPKLSALEEVFEKALRLNRGRVFCDIWDLEEFSDCEGCFNDRLARFQKMNIEQKIFPGISCDCN